MKKWRAIASVGEEFLTDDQILEALYDGDLMDETDLNQAAVTAGWDHSDDDSLSVLQILIMKLYPLIIIAWMMKLINNDQVSENNSTNYTWKPSILLLFSFDDSDWQIAEQQFYTLLDYFIQFFDSSFFDAVADQSNRRTLQSNHSKLLKVTSEEYICLVGAHIVCGCMRLPRVRMYYQPSLRVPAVTQIKRDRFFTLHNYMHFVDNLSETNSKSHLWKIQPVIDTFHRKCSKIPFSKELSIEEQMIPFTGTTKLKQYVRGKPNPVGLKNYLLASADGIIHDFFIYQVANTWPGGKPNSKVGIGGSVVLKLTENCPHGHILYFDRYFTSVPLLEELIKSDLCSWDNSSNQNSKNYCDRMRFTKMFKSVRNKIVLTLQALG